MVGEVEGGSPASESSTNSVGAAVVSMQSNEDSDATEASREARLGGNVGDDEAHLRVAAIRQWRRGAAASRRQWRGEARLGFARDAEEQSEIERGESTRDKRGERGILCPPHGISGTRGGRAERPAMALGRYRDGGQGRPGRFFTEPPALPFSW